MRLRRVPGWLAVASLVGLWPTATAIPAEAADETCGTCHPESRVAVAASVHVAEGITCTDCHGGNPATLETNSAHRGNFRSLANRLDSPAHCAECHSDLAKMRPYNLPVDQHAVYLTSRHGQALAAGDARAAICSDCHGFHDVRKVRDPLSPVSPLNVTDTCARCHGDEDLMSAYGIDSGVVDAYRSSIHAQMLLAERNLAAPNCTNCHGSHGPAPPGVGDIDKVCGSCHVDARLAFLDGPHYQAMLDADLPECASCHSNHAIRRFDLAGIEPLCIECHGEGSDQAILGGKFTSLIEGTLDELAEAEDLIERAQRVPLNVDDHLGRIEEGRTFLTEAYPLVHAVKLDPVERVTRRARSIGSEIQHELYSRLDRRVAHAALAVFWFYLLMTVAILWRYRRRLTVTGIRESE